MAELISSKDNKNIKHVQKVINSAKYRKEIGEFAIEGLRLCDDAILSGVSVISLFYTEKAFLKYESFFNSALQKSAKAYVVSEEAMKKISTTETPQGIVCLCEQNHILFNTDKLKCAEDSLKMVGLENVQDPSNMGTILRTAEALGIDAVILAEDCCDIYSPKVLRGSMGAVFRLPIFFSENINDTIKYLKSNNIKTYATVPKTDAFDIISIDFSGSGMTVFGNEGNGIKEETINNCDARITIPMLGNAESLNVSIAAGIVMWEMMRGR